MSVDILNVIILSTENIVVQSIHNLFEFIIYNFINLFFILITKKTYRDPPVQYHRLGRI